MLRKYVTSMSREIFDAYGCRMIYSTLKYWPEGELHIYCEEGELPYFDKRIVYHDLHQVPGLEDFMQATSAFPIFDGWFDGKVNYKFQVRRFARKAYAQMDAASDYRGFLYWIDADTYTTKAIPGAWLDDMLQSDFMCVMKRKTWHLCSSFVGWNMAHGFAKLWWPHYAETYASGKIFCLPQWDDAFVLEATIEDMPGVKDLAENISGEGPYNVFDAVFSGYAQHDKGPQKLQKLASNRMELRGPQRYVHLFEAIQSLMPSSIVEIGTWNGTRATQMAQLSPGLKYYGFDLFEDASAQTDREEKNVKDHYSMADVQKRLVDAGVTCELFKGNTRETFPAFLREHGESCVDMVFLDGGHSVETIRSDLECARKAVRPGGLIVLDDYYTDMPDDELRQFGCQEVLKDLEYHLLPTKDNVQGGGYVQMALLAA